MLQDIIQARHLGGHRIWVRFQDGVEGEVDLSKLIFFTGALGPLRDPAYVAQVRVSPDLGTICWPNNVDLDPVVLYAAITGREVGEILRAEPASGPPPGADPASIQR